MYLDFSSCRQLLDALAAARPRGTRWLLCVAEPQAGLVPELLALAGAEGLPLCGGIFPGLIVGSAQLANGVLAWPMPAGTQLCCATPGDEGAARWDRDFPALPASAPVSALILVDSLAAPVASVLEAAFDYYGNHIHYAGAGAGFHDLRQAPAVFAESGFLNGGGLLLVMPLATAVGVRHGWRRVRGPYIATRTRGNVIEELNWEAAGPFYRNEVERLAPAFRGRPVFPDLGSHFPLGIGKEGGEDVMRDPIAIGAAGELQVLSEVSENSVMYLTQGEETTLIEAACQAVAACSAAADADFCFIADCYSRTLMLGERFSRELSAVATALAAITGQPAEGVLAFGEIAANGTSSLEMYNKTFVVALGRSVS